MSIEQELNDVNASLEVTSPQIGTDAAFRWKRIMTTQMHPAEHVYLAPSLTRTPTPPLLLDKSKEVVPSTQSSHLPKSSNPAFSASDEPQAESSASDSSVRVCVSSFCFSYPPYHPSLKGVRG